MSVCHVGTGICLSGLFKIKVGIVRHHIGNAPGKLLILPHHYKRHSRDGCTGDRNAGCIQRELIPVPRNTEPHMRISGQDRTSVFCFSPIHSPGIADKREASLLHKRAEGGLSLHQCKELFGLKVTAAASCAVCGFRSCILGREGKKTVELSRIEHLCQHAVTEFTEPVNVLIPGHQPRNGDRVGRSPFDRGNIEKRKLHRQTSSVICHKIIHTSGVRFQNREDLGSGLLFNCFCSLPETEGALMDIERDQLLAQKVCKPAFSSKLKKCHLPDSLLSMNVTCNIEEVSLIRSKDIGSAVRIPMYLSRRFNPAGYMGSIVVGYG